MRTPDRPNPYRSLFLVIALLALLLGTPLAASALPARTYTINVEVRDSQDKAVPDALVLLRTAPIEGSLDGPASNASIRTLEATTNLAGRTRILLPVGVNQSTPAAHLSVYTPFWSSTALDLRLQDDPQDAIERSVIIPLIFNTYRIRLSDSQGNAVPQASVQFTQPYPLAKFTDANGLVQVRLPALYDVQGYIRYQGGAQTFSFANTSASGQAYDLGFVTPLRSAVRPWNMSYDWSVQLLDAMGQPILQRPAEIQSMGQTWTYKTDREGRLYLRELPSANLTLSWTSYNYTYRFPLNISRPPARIQMPLLIHIDDPIKTELGDSCYRIDLNVSDARNHPDLQVLARPIDGSTIMPFTLDKTVEMANGSGIHFSRILCVEQDTAFDIQATNPYEQVSLRIQLKTSENLAPAASSIYAQPPPPGLLEKKHENTAGRLELILVLVYALFALVVILLAIHFRATLLYYAQSILRFTYTSYQDRHTGAPPAAASGAQPPSSSPPASPSAPAQPSASPPVPAQPPAKPNN